MFIDISYRDIGYYDTSGRISFTNWAYKYRQSEWNPWPNCYLMVVNYLFFCTCMYKLKY